MSIGEVITRRKDIFGIVGKELGERSEGRGELEDGCVSLWGISRGFVV